MRKPQKRESRPHPTTDSGQELARGPHFLGNIVLVLGVVSHRPEFSHSLASGWAAFHTLVKSRFAILGWSIGSRLTRQDLITAIHHKRLTSDPTRFI